MTVSTILTMVGGTITGNTAVNAGGRFSLSTAASTVQGGVIGNNTVRGHGRGGSVRLHSAGRMTASGGTISEHQAPYGAVLQC
ncbi:hypothetical protein [Deinococcus aquiradiocola]|nr:hypothetical protein [Deinococcus aquiradiocola]